MFYWSEVALIDCADLIFNYYLNEAGFQNIQPHQAKPGHHWKSTQSSRARAHQTQTRLYLVPHR